MDRLRALEALPWDEPFRMVDRLIECRPGERIATSKNVTAGDPALGGAGSGCFPSLLLVEGMSQSAALLFRMTYREQEGALPLLGWFRVTFHDTVGPASQILFHVLSRKMTRAGGLFEARAEVLGQVVAEAELAFSAAGQEEPAP